MLSYSEMKKALIDRKCSTKYFTREFYEGLINERQESIRNFLATGKYSLWVKSEASDFYNHNGVSWCIMLEILNENTQKWRIEFYDKTYSTALVATKYIRADTEEEADKWARVWASDTLGSSEYVHEVMAVA